MKRKKQLMTLLMATIMIGSNVAVLNNKAFAAGAGNIMVFVDNNLVQFKDGQPQIIKDRTMVPVRELANALGAEVQWNDKEKKVTLISGDRYAVLVVGNSKMTYGTLKQSSDGKREVATTQVFDLDSPPVIVKDRALFPASAIGTAFGAESKWVGETKTVYITTAKKPTQTSVPAPSNGPADPAFADTAYFQEVSGRRIEDMHAGRNKFAVIIYDGQNPDAKAKMNMVKSAAANTQFKIYGFDTTSTRFTNPEHLKWTWNIVSKTSTDYPIIILSYAGQKDELLPSDISQSELEKKLLNLKQDYPALTTPTPSPTPSATATPTPSPSASATPKPSGDYAWKSISKSESKDKMDDRSSFIYVVYNSKGNAYYEPYIKAVQDAAKDVGVTLYYTDLKSEDVYADDDWWLTEDLDTKDIPSPTILLIENGKIIADLLRSDDKSFYVSEFKSFKEKL